VQLGFAGNRYFADQAGFTLYAYEGNGRCADACLKTHRPLVAAALARPIGPWSALAHEDGTRVWAYNGKPVYTYLKDAHPGEAMGEDGEGKWRALVEYKAELPSEVSTGMTETGPVYIEKATGKTLYYQGFNHRPYIYVGFHKGVFSNCYNECAEAYPPLLAAPGAKPVGEWWLLTRVDGTKQWAYRGLPIYTYRADTPGRHLAAANGRIWTEAIANNPNTLRLR
jgi:predicted lipoprotein with Yx(FWY)xxD motif